MSTQDPKDQGSSATTLLCTLAPVALVAIVWFTLFLFLRRKFPRKYEPRSFVGSLEEHHRSPTLGTGMFSWLSEMFKISDSYILNHHSLDAYLFLRFLKICIVTCIVGCCITWPVLFPINITGGGTKTQLDILTWGNVTDNNFKFFAHAGCAWIFFGFVMYMITRESIYYINLRQAYLMSPLYSARMSSRTVLFTSVPNDYLNEAKLRDMFGSHVRHIWFPTNTKDLDEMVSDRDKALMKLEGAETKLVKLANAARLKAQKKSGGRQEEGPITDESGESGSVAARYIRPKNRPTHRLKPIIGKKVDTINWCRAELSTLIPKVAQEQEKHKRGEAPLLNSVFIEFDSLAEAQAAYQSLSHHQVLHMAPRFTGMTPGDIIWSNLRIKWYERIIRLILTTSFVVALIIFWSIPVGFVGAISNIKKLIEILPFLSFLNSVPDVLFGVIQGLLPTILLAVLMALLPIVLRLMAKLSGDPSYSAVEMTTQNYYFGFQLIQVFLVATIGSAAASSISAVIDDPSSVTSLLSTNIPAASNFYLAYFVLQGLGIVAGLLVGVVGLLLFYILGKLLDKTPRKMYKRWSSLAGVGWGTLYPIYTNLFVIALCYAVIAPLVMGFAAIGLWLFYFCFRYNFLFVYDANIDCKGRGYPRALQHLFVGIYIAEICIIGLIGVGFSDIGALGPLLLMILLLVFTALYHVSLNSALQPLIEFLPKSIEAEERRLLSTESNQLRGDSADKDAINGDAPEILAATTADPAPHKKPGMFKKWLRPDVYCDYATMRRLVPRQLAQTVIDSYTDEVTADAYYNPSIVSGVPLLWIPRDEMGVSRQEVRDSGKVVPITDVGTHLDDKNKIQWDEFNARPPIYEQKIYY